MYLTNRLLVVATDSLQLYYTLKVWHIWYDCMSRLWVVSEGLEVPRMIEFAEKNLIYNDKTEYHPPSDAAAAQNYCYCKIYHDFCHIMGTRHQIEPFTSGYRVISCVDFACFVFTKVGQYSMAIELNIR